MDSNLQQVITLDGDRAFEFVFNIQTNGRLIQLSQSSILYLEIQESIFNGFPEGIAILDNNTGSLDNVFTFSGDSTTDLILFSIVPEKQDPKENYMIKEVFSIYKIEDIPVGEYPQNAKKLFFRNTLANELRVKKNALTVEDFLDGDVSNLSDNERAVKTGDILKKLFGKDRKPGVPRTADFKIDEQNWDEGKYSIYPNWCPGTETLFDSIQKVYMKHVSSEAPYDKCYLRYDRFKKELSLMPMSKLLMLNKEDPDNFFIENLVMGSEGSDEESQENSDKESVVSESSAPLPKVSANDTLLDLSNIKSFKFNDLCGEILEKDFTINIPTVVGFDNTTRFDLGEKNIKEEIFKDFETYYVENPFTDRVEGGKPLPPILWHSFRKKITTQYNKALVSPYKSWDHAYDVEVRANILSLLLFKSLTCTISLRGATHRTVGKFVDIEMKDSFITNKFTKIPGRWLVTECSHIIIQDKYWNSLNCIKTYRNF
jgi:hypothetical protein